MNHFFVSCPIHFEKELIKEIESFWHLMIDLDGLPTRVTLPEFEIDKGGLEFTCPIHLGLQINFLSRIANRVLLRHSTFKARFFDQFEKEFKKIDFGKVFDFSLNKTISLEIESSKSRLFHEKNLLESAHKIFAEKKIQIVKESDFKILVRIFNDIVTISFDTSGEHLHFRGYRKNQGYAPIRENLAALVLQLAGLNTSAPKAILDPFCGAGTLLFESALLGIPQFQRQFPFLKFLNTPALFKSPTWTKNFKWIRPAEMKLVGIEKDLETLQKCQENLKSFSELYYPLHPHLMCADSGVVDLKALPFVATDNLWLVTNPPYGERLFSEQIPQILKRFESLKMLQGMIILHPLDWKFDFKDMTLSQSIPFLNQGLKLSLSIFIRK